MPPVLSTLTSTLNVEPTLADGTRAVLVVPESTTLNTGWVSALIKCVRERTEIPIARIRTKQNRLLRFI
jgi:hypothetical protein